MQLPHTRPTSCADSANWRLGSDSGLQYRRFQITLLQRHVLQCTGRDFRHTAAGSEQLSQSRLPARRSNWRQTTSEVAPLAASKVSSDIQDGVTDVQDNVFLNASVYIWATWSGRLFQFVLCGHPTPAAECPKNAMRALRSLAGHFRSRPRAPGTHYHLTLDPAVAVLWTLSKDTWRPICSDSLNLMPPCASVSSDFMALYKSYFIIIIIVCFYLNGE